jgi:acyl-CoA dehydrogenase
MAPSATRDRLTAGIFVPASLDEPLGRIEAALPEVIAAEPIEKKLRDARRNQRIPGTEASGAYTAAIAAGVITAAEAQTLAGADAARSAVIRVDDFPFASFQRGERHA